jgi:hypothetical protein
VSSRRLAARCGRVRPACTPRGAKGGRGRCTGFGMIVEGAMWKRGPRCSISSVRHRAEFARRSPPRLSRCRSFLPLLVSSGETLHRWAKSPSLRRRSGLSPAASSSADVVSVPSPMTARSSGAVSATSGTRRASSLSAHPILAAGSKALFCTPWRRPFGGSAFMAVVPRGAAAGSTR